MKRINYEPLEHPWYGQFVVMLTCTDFQGNRYRHPVSWYQTYRQAETLLDMLMKDYYRGKMHRPDEIPVIVDYTGMRKQKLPKEYNHVVVEGDLSTL